MNHSGCFRQAGTDRFGLPSGRVKTESGLLLFPFPALSCSSSVGQDVDAKKPDYVEQRMAA